MTPKSNSTELPQSDLQRLISSGRVLVTTSEAARILNLKSQTLYKNACYQQGPIQPIRVGKSLRWRVCDIIAIVGGAA